MDYYKDLRKYTIDNQDIGMLIKILRGIFSKDDNYKRKGFALLYINKGDTSGLTYRCKAFSEVFGLNVSFFTIDKYTSKRICDNNYERRARKVRVSFSFLSESVESSEKIADVQEIDLLFSNRQSGFNRRKGDLVELDEEKIHKYKGDFYGFPNEDIEDFIKRREELVHTRDFFEDDYYSKLASIYIMRKVGKDKDKEKLKKEIDMKHKTIRGFDEVLYEFIEDNIFSMNI